MWGLGRVSLDFSLPQAPSTPYSSMGPSNLFYKLIKQSFHSRLLGASSNQIAAPESLHSRYFVTDTGLALMIDHLFVLGTQLDIRYIPSPQRAQSLERAGGQREMLITHWRESWKEHLPSACEHVVTLS